MQFAKLHSYIVLYRQAILSDVVRERSEVSIMNRNTRRARAIAIAQAKPEPKLVALRSLMIAAGATAAFVTLLLSHLI